MLRIPERDIHMTKKAVPASFTFRQCCERVIAAASTTPRQVNYAVGYARVGLGLTVPREIAVQALYILNNISSWRGAEAKAVRESLKVIGGAK